MALASAAFVHQYQELCKRLEQENYKETALEMFNSVSSDEDRVAVCLWLMEMLNVAVREEIRPTNASIKNFKKAMDLKNKGNMKFATKDYTGAILLYTKSIAIAPMNSTDEDPETRCLSVTLANRSAASWHLRKYRDCIQDIDSALHFGYPWELKSKLYLRRGKCEKLLGSVDAAKDNFQMALDYLKFSSDKNIGKEITNGLEEIATQLEGISLTDSMEEQMLPVLKNGSSKKILSASKVVDIAYLPSMGRHLIATQPIDPGDVLVIETPYSSVLFEDYCYTHCYNCLKRSQVLIPCINCTKVMFCSNDCRESAWKNYHEIECPILPYLYQMKVGRNGLLAMKTVLKVFLSEDYLEVRKNIFKEATLEESLRGLNDEGAYSALNYNAIFWLVTNTEQKPEVELFEYAMLASFMVKILEKYTPFFNLVQVKSLVYSGLKEMGNIFGSLLLRHLHNFPCNAHSVVEMITLSETNTEGCVEIGAAAYATLSLINHSCDPNVGRFNHNGDIGVLRAIKSIAPGEQLFDNYGYHYSLLDKETRQNALLCYYQFSCNCQACCEDWPKYSHQRSDNPVFLCQKCKAELNATGKCSKCGTKHDLTEIQTYMQHSTEKIDRIIIKLQDGITVSEAEIEILIKHLKILDLNVKLPWQQYCSCQEALKHYFSKMGNYFSVLK